MRNPVLNDGFVANLCRRGLAIVLALAGAMKLHDPAPARAFVEAITTVDIPGVGVAIGLVELMLAGALMMRFSQKLTAAGAVSVSLAFFVVHAFSLTLPEPPPPCGCLGDLVHSIEPDTPESGSHRAGPWLVITACMTLASGMLFLSTESPRRDHTEATAC